MPDLLTTVSFWSLVVSVVALGVSIWVHFRATRLKAESNDLQARLVDLEEEREVDRQYRRASADISATLNERPDGTLKEALIIENNGNVPAQDVQVELDGDLIQDHEDVDFGDSEITSIDDGAQEVILVSIYRQHRPPFDLRITWEDETGEGKSCETTLAAGWSN